ncbi:tetratricopeptide repeat protein [Thermodesulfobacteriota bacterium]
MLKSFDGVVGSIMTSTRKNKREALRTLMGLVLMMAATLAIYYQVLGFEFVNYDDNVYITDNPRVQKGLNLENIVWAFTTSTWESNYWQPLTWLSHMLDVRLFGMNPGGHHLTNLIFHLANSLLLFHLFRQMSGQFWQSMVVAALFALHPLHVESVAWVSERKDVLSSLFWILAMIAYTHYVRDQSLRPYLLALALFVAGLMAKPMIVTLPFVLLLMDYWPLGRMRFGQRHASGSNAHTPTKVIDLAKEKIPFFAILPVIVGVTYFAQQEGGALKSLDAYPFSVRIANALVAYVVYIKKTIWPHPLAFLYPHPGELPVWQILGAGVVLLFISLWAVRSGKFHPWFIVGWLWFLGTLVPVIGLVVIGPHVIADRYTYIPLVGLFIIVGWGIFELMERRHFIRMFWPAVTLVCLVVFSLVSWFQVKTWANNMALYTHALKVTHDNSVTHNHLGLALLEQGKPAAAVTHFSEALRITPHYADAHNNMGVALVRLGRLDDAQRHFSESMRLNPNSRNVYLNLAHTLTEQGQAAEAIAYYEKALEIDPDHPETQFQLGLAFYSLGMLDQAINHFNRTAVLNPDNPMVQYHLGRVHLARGDFETSIKYLTETLRRVPDNADAHNDLGVALFDQGRALEAISHFRQAVELDPEHVEARGNLKAALGVLKKDG